MFLAALISLLIFVAEPVLARAPNDPMYGDQELIWNQVNAPAAWDYAVGSKRIVVAMIDTGMDSWHEDLRDNLWVNGEEIPGNGIDDDHNGYVDDISGWNFVENDNDVRTSVFDTTDDKEAVRHGTLLGGIIGARGDNGLDGTGVNWRISLMPLRAIRSDGKGAFRAVTEAVNYAVDNGADVISLSFMGDMPETTLLSALRRAYDKGIVIVTAAGNYDSPDSSVCNLNKNPLYPACYDHEGDSSENWSITVGSVDKDDVLSQFSNYGKCVDIMAPGEYIYNTERYAPQFGYPNEFGGPWFGTSFATPLVAGTAALIKSIHPEWSAKKIISTILITADPIDSVNPGREGDLGRGRLNVGRAITLAIATPVMVGKGGIYYLKGSVIMKYDLGSGGRAKPTRFLNGAPVAIATTAHYNREQVAVLVSRGGKYFLDVYKDDGQLVDEFTIPKGVVIGRSVIQFSSGIFSIDSRQYDKRAKKTKISVFNVRSGRSSLAVFPGDVVGEANEAAGGLSAKVIQRDKKVILRIVDHASGNISEKELSTAVRKHWLLKIITMADRSLFLPYTTEGGSFIAYDSDFSQALTVRIPKR